MISKEIQLPTNEASLTASCIPTAPEDKPYSYEWQLVAYTRKGAAGNGGGNGANDNSAKDQSEAGNMQNSHSQQLQLTELEEGEYQFKVKVTGDNVIGEARGNVTVLPRESLLHHNLFGVVISLVQSRLPPGAERESEYHRLSSALLFTQFITRCCRPCWT